MKSLVDIAKEMGFEPNPNLTKDDWEYLVDALKTYMLQTPTGLSLDNRAEQRRHLSIAKLPDLIYYTNCIQKRGGVEDVVIRNIKHLKSGNKNIFPTPQTIPGDLEKTSFIWHHPNNTNGEDIKERFTADINMASRIFPDMLKRLDAFAFKHQASFKFPNFHTRHRVDTLNIYMKKDITPEIAQELYGILKPCLRATHHNRLNGQEIYMDGRSVKGIKIGPVLNGDRNSFDERAANKDQWLKRDITNSDLRNRANFYLVKWLGDAPKSDGTPVTQPSLGSVTTSVELMNLMYYMLGKEGQNPFQLLGYDNKPYQKHISFTAESEKEKPKMADSIWQKVTSLFHKSEEKPTPPNNTFDWKDPKLWSDVQTRNANGVYYGHRINIQYLTPDQRAQVKAGLEKRHIQFTERQATKATADIHPGDLTIRITDPKSVEVLRGLVFNWAIGPGTRPVFKTNEEYDAEQKLIQEKRTASASQEDSPKWADKRYWTKTSNLNDGKLEQNYVMDLGDPNDRLHDNPQPFGSGVEIIKALSEKGIDAKIGRSITNGLPSYLMTHDSVIISGSENVERFEKTVLRQTQAPTLTPHKGYDR